MERDSHDLIPPDRDPRVAGQRVPRWPSLGEEWEGLLFLDELGRGAISRVYLAEEIATGRRLVAVKLTPHATREPRLQGRLYHEHVVPIYSARWSADWRFQIAIMPYRGRATLCDVIRYARGLRARSDSSVPGGSEWSSDSSDGILEVVAGTVEWVDPVEPAEPLDHVGETESDGIGGAGLSPLAESKQERVQRLELRESLYELELLLAASAYEDPEEDFEENFAENFDETTTLGGGELGELLAGLAIGDATYLQDDEVPLESLVIDVLRVGIEIAGALEHSHSRGVYHCDLKPSNVLVDAVGRILLIDFNLAIERSDLAGPLGGTLPYMPPERLAPYGWRAGSHEFRERISPAGSDLYSLAALMYELLTGEPPYGGGDRSRSLAEQALSILSRQLEGISSSPKPDVAKFTRAERLVIELLDECLDCRSGRRLSDLSEFVRRAEAILVLAEQPCRSWRPHWLAKVPRRAGWLMVLAAALAVALVGERWFLNTTSRPLVGEATVDFELGLRASLGKVRSDFFPADHESWGLVGDGYLYQGQSLAAIGSYEHARRMGCENPALFNNSGLAKTRLGRFAAAERDFDEAVRRDEFLIEAYVNRARSNYAWLLELNSDATSPDSRALANRLLFQIRRDELRVRELGGEPPLPKSWEPVKLAGLSPEWTDG